MLNSPFKKIYVFVHAGYLQASRALMITSVVFGTFGVVLTLIGMQCCKAAEDNPVLKGKLTGTGGVVFFLQGKNHT